MATNFPTTLDDATSLPVESSSTPLSTNHVTAHQNLQDAIEAIEAKIGVDGSAVTTSHDYKLSEVTSTDKAVGKTATQTLTNKTLASPTVTTPTITTPTINGNPTGTFVTAIANGGTGQNTAALAINALVPSQTSNSGKFLTTDGSIISWANVVSSTADRLLFGDGSDGNVTISGNTTLTRDMYYNDLTINSGVTLSTANFKIFVAGTLTNNNATNGIVCNGVNGDAGGIGGAGGVAVVSGSLRGGGNGGAGQFGGSHGGGGAAGAGFVWVSAKTIAVQGGVQAVGGNGGNASGPSPGGPGAAAIAGSSSASTFITTGSGGSGGGGAAGGTITTTKQSSKNLALLFSLFDPILSAAIGGGGGGGGGFGSSGGGSGGGGGGMGGVTLFIYRTLTSAGTVTTAGGTGGTGQGGGAAGGNGSSGISISIQVI